MNENCAVFERESKFLLQNYERYPLVVKAASGCYLYDPEGRRYLDMVAGIGVNAFGYAYPRFAAAFAEQAPACLHTSNLVYHPYQGLVAEKLCSISGLDRVFFSNSGTEAMEAGLKAVRARAASHGREPRLVALRGSFHGRTLGSLSVTGQPELRRPFEPLGAEVTFVEPNDMAALRTAIDGRTAALVLEPVIGEGGIYPLELPYLRLARELTAAAGALLVADETQCGLGRTGRHFAYQWAGIRPDIVVAAKPLAAGLPLGATLFDETAAAYLPLHSHGSTFGGGPLACRLALEFLSELDDALARVAEVARQLRAGLEMLKRHPAVTEIRSKGLMFGIQLSHPGRPVVEAALQRGLLINCVQENILRLLPPYIIGREEIELAVDTLDAVLGSSAGVHVSRLTVAPGNCSIGRYEQQDANQPGYVQRGRVVRSSGGVRAAKSSVPEWDSGGAAGPRQPSAAEAADGVRYRRRAADSRDRGDQ